MLPRILAKTARQVLGRNFFACSLTRASYSQVSTTKGTGGDVIILEEAAYCDPGFFYETVAPLMLIGRTSLLAISTLTSEINFYSRLIKMKDPLTQVFFVHACISLGWDSNFI